MQIFNFLDFDKKFEKIEKSSILSILTKFH